MLLDEVHLKDERLKLGPDHDPLNDLTISRTSRRVFAS